VEQQVEQENAAKYLLNHFEHFWFFGLSSMVGIVLRLNTHHHGVAQDHTDCKHLERMAGGDAMDRSPKAAHFRVVPHLHRALYLQHLLIALQMGSLGRGNSISLDGKTFSHGVTELLPEAGFHSIASSIDHFLADRVAPTEAAAPIKLFDPISISVRDRFRLLPQGATA
jgi:hypothetical protein